MHATSYANFFPAARKSRQVDLLVRIATRTAHVEVKGLSAGYPVRGRANGPWIQRLPDGTERPLGTNCGRQALDGTYAISDAMRSLARTGAVTAAEDDFKRHIDSIVGMWQTIPDGSDIEAPPHVTVLGYSDLLQQLITPGPVVPWTDDEWDAFARHLNLFHPETESPPSGAGATAPRSSPTAGCGPAPASPTASPLASTSARPAVMAQT